MRFAGSGWCAQEVVPSLTINFGRLIKVCAVKTAGNVVAYSIRVRVEFSVDADGSSFFDSEVNLFEEDLSILYNEGN